MYIFTWLYILFSTNSASKTFVVNVFFFFSVWWRKKPIDCFALHCSLKKEYINLYIYDTLSLPSGKMLYVSSPCISKQENSFSGPYSAFSSPPPLTSSVSTSQSSTSSYSASSPIAYQKDLKEEFRSGGLESRERNTCEVGITLEEEKKVVPARLASNPSPNMEGTDDSFSGESRRSSLSSAVSSPSTLPTPPRWVPVEKEEQKEVNPAVASKTTTGSQGITPSSSPPSTFEIGLSDEGEEERELGKLLGISFKPELREWHNTSSSVMEEEKLHGVLPSSTTHGNYSVDRNDIFTSTLARLSQSCDEALRQTSSPGNSTTNTWSRTSNSGAAPPLPHHHSAGNLTASHDPDPSSSPLSVSPSLPPPSHGHRMERTSTSTLYPLPTSSSSPSSVVAVHPAEYSDRRRLLYHITHLTTQYQRAQLQVEEQQAALVLLHAHFQALQEKVHHAEKGNGKQKGKPHPISPSGTEGEKKERKDDESEEVVNWAQVEVHPSGLTAALLVAKNEAALQEHIQDRLALFDPLLAQSQINRLDDALAHVSLLREAELARAQQAEEVEIPPLRVECEALRKEVQSLREQNMQLTQQCGTQKEQILSTSSEVERLRREEAQLNHQLAVLQHFQHTIAGTPSEVPGSSAPGGRERNFAQRLPAPHPYAASIEYLMEEETHARQALWLSMFWEPMAMAFDAGLTWQLEMEKRESECQFAALEDAIKKETELRRAMYPDVVHQALRMEEEEEIRRNLTSATALLTNVAGTSVTEQGEIGKEKLGKSSIPLAPQHLHSSQESLPRSGSSGKKYNCSDTFYENNRSSNTTFGCRERTVYGPSNSNGLTDADLLLLQNQQAELREMRLQLERAQDQKHLLESEVSRLEVMYNNEKEQAIKLSENHIVQLHRAYQEIVRDRQLIKASLQKEVQEQVKAAFSEGRLYEQKLRSNDSRT